MTDTMLFEGSPEILILESGGQGAQGSAGATGAVIVEDGSSSAPAGMIEVDVLRGFIPAPELSTGSACSQVIAAIQH